MANAGLIINPINAGARAGPLTPAVGDLVATPRGPRPASLEGFSEDINQDGFVDPVAQVAPIAPVAVAAPVVAAPAVRTVAYSSPIVSSNIISSPIISAPYAAAPVVKTVEVKAAEPVVVKAPEPVVLKAAAAPIISAPVAPLTYAAAPAVIAGPRLAQHALLAPGLTLNPYNALPQTTLIAAGIPAVAPVAAVAAEEAVVVAEE